MPSKRRIAFSMNTATPLKNHFHELRMILHLYLFLYRSPGTSGPTCHYLQNSLPCLMNLRLVKFLYSLKRPPNFTYFSPSINFIFVRRLSHFMLMKLALYLLYFVFMVASQNGLMHFSNPNLYYLMTTMPFLKNSYLFMKIRNKEPN